MKNLYKNKLVLAMTLVLGLALTVPGLAGAVDDTDTNSRVQQAQEARQQRLSDKKLENCENRQTRITNIMRRIGNRAERQLELFTKITERVQNFYTTKSLSVENYDTLVATIATKKAAAQSLVDELGTIVVDFDCGGDDPKGVAETFKTKLEEVIAAMREYKDSIRELITAVRTATIETQEGEGDE